MYWLNVLLTIASANNLSHVVYFHEDGGYNDTGEYIDIIPQRFIDLPCSALRLQNVDWQFVIGEITPVINLGIDCPKIHHLQEPREEKATYLRNPVFNVLIIDEPRFNVPSWKAEDFEHWGITQSFYYVSEMSSDTLGDTELPKTFSTCMNELGNKTSCLIHDANGTAVAILNRGGGSICTSKVPLITEEFLGFKRRKFIVGVVNILFFSTKEKMGNKIVWNGYLLEFLDEMKEELQFEYEIKETELFGLKENGTWKGLIGLVHEKEIDMAVAYIIPTRSREGVVDFMPLLVNSNLYVYYKLNNKKSVHFFMLPFSSPVYVTVLVSIMFIGIFFWLADFAAGTILPRNVSLPKCLLMGLGITLNKGIHPGFVHRATMVTLPFVYFGALGVASVYTGNLVAALSSNTVYPPYTSLEEVASEDRYPIYIADGGAETEIMLGSNVSSHKKISKRLKFFQNESVQEHAISNARDSMFIIINDLSFDSITRIAHQCDWMRVHDNIVPFYGSFALPAKSPYFEIFYKLSNSFSEMGMTKRLKSQAFARLPNQCQGEKMRSSGPRVALLDVKALLYGLLFGLGVAVVTLFCENYFSKTTWICGGISLLKRNENSE